MLVLTVFNRVRVIHAQRSPSQRASLNVRNKARHASVLAALLGTTVLLASCASTPRQTDADRATVLSAIHIGQRVKVSWVDPRGWSWGPTECNVTFKNDDGMSCGIDFIFFDRVTSIGLTTAHGMNYALVPLVPVMVGAWMVGSVFAPPEKPPDASAQDRCGVSYLDTVAAERATTIVRVPDPVDANSHYPGDGKPDTIEIVTWPAGQHGHSRIEADGEVIYLAPDSPDDAKRQLVKEAIYFRLVKKNHKAECSTAPPSPP